jgi:hypothetical protein
MWNKIASTLKRDVDGADLAHQCLVDEPLRHQVERMLQSDAIGDGLPSSKIFEVHPTTSSNHPSRSEPYVVAMSGQTIREIEAHDLVMISALIGIRRMTCLARVVKDDKREAGVVGLDQTIRTALGLARTGKVLGYVGVTPIRLTASQRIANKLSWVAGRRYLLLRVAPPDPPDIEKTLCRIFEDDQRSMGVETGGRVLLIAPHPDGPRIKERSVQALPLTKDMGAERQTRTGQESRAGHDWDERYPDTPALLAIDGHNDLRPIWVDKDIRDYLNLRAGDVALVRRSVPNALLGQLLDFGVVLLAAVLALDRILPHPEWLSAVIAVIITAAIMVARLRSKLG